MDSAEIGELARRVERVTELFVGVEQARIELVVGARNGVRNVVAVDPSDGRALRDCQRLRCEREIVDRHFRRRRSAMPNSRRRR